MSAFDRRVLEWLNTSTLADKSKVTLLQRTSVGISNYRNITTTGPAKTHEGTSTIPFHVDFTLEDHVNKAVRKLTNGEHKAGEPLFPTLFGDASRAPPPVKKGSKERAAPKSASPSASPQAKEEHQAAQSQQPKPKASQEQLNASTDFSSFKFGAEAQPDEEKPVIAVTQDDDDCLPDAMIDEHEDRRRRLTMYKRVSRHAVCGEAVKQEDFSTYACSSVPKPPEILQRVVHALEGHQLFCHLDDNDISTVADMMSVRSCKRGEVILEKGKPNSTFYIVVTGSCFAGEERRKLNVENSFGEVALLYETTSEETVEVAVTNTQLCTIDRADYKIVCAKASHDKRQRYEGFLAGVRFLGGLSRLERLQLADALKSAKYQKGDYIIKFGEEGTWFNIILEGTVDVVGRNAKGEKVHVCSFHEGDCIGELEFLFKHKTVADCIAATVVRTAKVSARHFEKVIGPAKEVLERQANNAEVYAYYRNAKKELFEHSGT